MKGIMIAVAAASLWPVAAHADVPSEAQANVIRHTAEAMVLAAKCDRVEVDATVATALMLAHDMPANAYSPGGPFETSIRRALDKARNDASGLSGEKACAAAMLMFGPNGGNAPRLMRMR